MKAYTYKNYGGPGNLELRHLAKPTPKSREVIVKVHSLSINPAEWHILRGSIWVIRLAHGFLQPRHQILGADIAGIVESVGEGVTKFKPRDPVFGRSFKDGLAEYARVKEEHLAHKPHKLTFRDASALPLAGISAHQAIKAYGKILPGTSVLINGASGGIGTFAVQLAKLKGAKVHGVCSQRNEEFVKSLGVESTIAYDSKNLYKTNHRYDLVIDMVGNIDASAISKIMKNYSTCIMLGFTNFKLIFKFITKGWLIAKRGNQLFQTMDVKTTTEALDYLAGLASIRKLKPVVDKEYGFDEVREAFTYLGTRRAKGKVVINVLPQ